MADCPNRLASVLRPYASVEWGIRQTCYNRGFCGVGSSDSRLYRLLSAGYESNGTQAERIRAMINEVYIDLRKLDSDNSR